MEEKSTILILGKLPPPLIGPAIATNIILNSSLKDEYELIHLDTRMNENLVTMGKWGFSKIYRSIRLYTDFLKKIRKHQPEIVLVPISQTTLGFIKDVPFIWIANSLGCKTLIQLRGSNIKNWLEKASSLTKMLVKSTFKKCVGVIVLGNNLKHLFTGYFNEDHIYVVPNGANYELQEKNTEEVTILYFANFLSTKSFDDILKAVALLKKKGITNFKLVGAGFWYEEFFEKECLTIIEKNELTNIELHPPQSGKAKMQLFANADVFVFCPKMPEGHPWVIVEAMANGLPVIATDKGAIVESVIDGENGFIVPSEEPNVIAEKLEQLINNSVLRKQFSEQSKALYQANFTEERMVENLKGVFEKVLMDNFV